MCSQILQLATKEELDVIKASYGLEEAISNGPKWQRENLKGWGADILNAEFENAGNIRTEADPGDSEFSENFVPSMTFNEQTGSVRVFVPIGKLTAEFGVKIIYVKNQDEKILGSQYIDPSQDVRPCCVAPKSIFALTDTCI